MDLKRVEYPFKVDDITIGTSSFFSANGTTLAHIYRVNGSLDNVSRESLSNMMDLRRKEHLISPVILKSEYTMCYCYELEYGGVVMIVTHPTGVCEGRLITDELKTLIHISKSN